jgi:8-oxo-dGTP diphosphatase
MYYAAVYGIIKNVDGQILFLERHNTGFQDGLYGLPAGHIEGYETYFEAIQREIREEV